MFPLLLRKSPPILAIIVIISGSIFLSYALLTSYITIWPQIYSVSTHKTTYTLKVGPAYPPVFAYLISGTRGDNRRLIRLLSSIYHSRNYSIFFKMKELLAHDAASKDLASLIASQKMHPRREQRYSWPSNEKKRFSC